MIARSKPAPVSASRLKAAAPAPETMALSVAEVQEWKEWLESHSDYVVTIFNAIEELAENVNAYARDFNQSRGFDNVHERYSEAEDHRNAALQKLRFIATTEKQIAQRMGELLLRHGNARSEKELRR